MNRGFRGEGSVAPLIFLRGMKAARATFDVASLHPYPPTGRLGFDDGTQAPNMTLYNIGDYLKELDRLWPSKRYRVWLTEYGVQSKPDRYGATLTGQATFVRTGVAKIKQDAAHLGADLVPDPRRADRGARRVRPLAVGPAHRDRRQEAVVPRLAGRRTDVERGLDSPPPRDGSSSCRSASARPARSRST